MKRYLITLTILLLSLGLKAQSGYTYHYWFDQDTEGRQTGLLGNGHLLLDVDALGSGVHMLHVTLEDSGLTSPQTYLFYKFDPTQSSPDLVYHYWFDQNTGNKQTGLLGEGHLLLDADSLEVGVHSLHLTLEDGGLTAPQTYLFYKFDPTQSSQDLVYHYWFDQDTEHRQTGLLGEGHLLLNAQGLETGVHMLHVTLEGSGLNAPQSYLFYKSDAMQGNPNPVYHYWFDQDTEHRQTGLLGEGNLLLDADTLQTGVHALHVTLEDGELTASQTYMFYKPESTGDENPNYALHYWFDDDNTVVHSVPVGSAFELEVDDLPDGLHALRVQLDNGKFSVPQCYWFYKRPVGGYVSGWEYWVNDNHTSHATKLLPNVDTLSVIALLPVEHCAIRSTCFHFHPNGDAPYINAKNKITFRVWVWDSFAERSAMYVDENVSEPIVADTLERNTITTIPAPRDNQIHWFKVEANRGDYLSFQADKACTLQLFAPSGEEVYAASGPESIVLEGFNVWEDGTYYLAVHDVTGSGEEVSITYNWIYRYTISSYDVHLVGNGGCSTITFQGNGFNSLLNVYLVNYQNDTIRSLDIGYESNTTTTVSLNFYQENLGVYDAVFEFFEETIRINGALEVQEPVDIMLTSSVSYPSAFLRNTPCTYTYTITNNGNMSAYVVPIYVYIASHTLDGISHIEFDGMDLPSVVDNMNLDSLSPSQIAELKEWEEDLGDDHFFSFFRMLDEETGDTIIARSNFFFISFAPFETKTLSIKITANEPINVWMTIPNETIQPLVPVQNRFSYNQFCCTLDKIECWLRVSSDILNVSSLVADAIAFVGLVFNLAGPEGIAISAVLLQIAAITTIASCSATTLDALARMLSATLCPQDTAGWIESVIQYAKSLSKSAWSMFMSCIPLHKLYKIADPRTVKMAIGFLKKAFIKQMAGLGTDGLAMIPFDDVNCFIEYHQKRPDCPPGNSIGGTANAANALDPNDIYGYLSESGSHYMRQEIQNVQYEIEFENDTALATAAAHTIIVRDTLNRSRFDLNSLAARSVTIGNKRLDLNGEQTFARTLDLRPEQYVIAQIEQDYNPTTGIIQWTIQSLDPMTMEPTDDPNQGVLPVNYYGNGVGFIDYSIDIKEAFADGTEISNRAGIIFDQEEVILTPTWTNIIDAVKPTSQIESVEVVNDSLLFSFVSEDNRSGVWYHTLYHRNDSTEMQWQVKKTQIIGNEFLLNHELLTTEYLVIAVDSAGNHEEKEMVAEYFYYYEGPGPTTQTDDLSAGWNWWSTYIEMNGANGLELLESGLGTNGLNIKSGNGNSVEYIPDWEMWWGDEIEVHNESMYEINVAQAGTVTVAGTQAIPGAHPITLAPGWNWIGYPVNASLPTETALASLSPTEEDVIQSRNGYSMYWPDFGFWGDVEYMTPGSGYKYMSNNAQPQTLTYPSSRGKALAYKPKTVETRPEAMQHQYLMDIVAVAELEGEELEAGHYELIALSEGQPRGRASLRYCEPNSRHVAMLVVYGEASETLEFRLLDTESGKVYEGAERMDFKADKVVGGLRKPFTIHFGKEQEDAFALEGMFPNPAKAGETVYVNMVDTSVEEGTSGIELYNALGEHIPVTCTMGSPLSFKAPQAAGVYMVRLTSRGEVYHGTLIVTH